MSAYTSRRRGAIVVVLALVVFGGILIISVLPPPCPPGDPKCDPTPPWTPTLPPEVITITMYSSDTKEDWLEEIVPEFNAAQFKTGLGNTIFVTVTHGNSGDSVKWIRAGTLTPTIWSPGEYSWVLALNQDWQGLHGQPLVAEACQPTVYAPVGFAMYRPMAEAMGWPDTPIRWQDLIDLMNDPRGWGRYNRPDWGQFKFGHTHPWRSNSGLLLLTALAYATSGKTQDLTLADVKSPAYQDALRTVELKTYHYGAKSRDNVSRMIQLGEAFLHATNTSEAEVLRANSGAYGKVYSPLAFIYPADGAFWAEQPFCVLDAQWVSPQQREAAWIFYDFLRDPVQQAKAVKNYLRPVEPTVPLIDPFLLANGTDPKVTPQIVPALGSVPPAVSEAIKEAFDQNRKGLALVLVLDTSASMRGDKIKAAGEAAARLVESDDLHANDEIYTYLFGAEVYELQPSGLVGANAVKDVLPDRLRTLIADGSTTLYDAVCLATQRVTALREADLAEGDPRLYGIVVLSDGKDTNSQLYTRNDVFNICLPSGEGVESIRAFTIAFGEDADKDFLIMLANVTRGKFYEAGLESIIEILTEILVQ